VIEEHERLHLDQTQFDGGAWVLNEYLTKYASQDVKRKAAAMFVMVNSAAAKRVFGFYALCSTSVELTSLPTELTKRLPRYPETPAILVGRLARNIDNPGLGALLLSDALSRCIRVSFCCQS